MAVTKQKQNPLYFNLLVAIGALVACFVFIEICFYSYDGYLELLYSEKDNVSMLHEADPLLGWRKRANTTGFFASKRNKYRNVININSHGLRDEEYDYAKAPGTKRILLLGDSVTVGYEVDKQSLIDTQLEALLANQGKYEVINAGTRAYGGDQSLLYLMTEGYRYAPDVIIYVAVLNDPLENITIHQRGRKAKPYFLAEETGELVLQGVPVPDVSPDSEWVLATPEAQAFYTGAFQGPLEDKAVSLRSFVKRLLVKSRFFSWIRQRLAMGVANRTGRASVPAAVEAQEVSITSRLITEMREYSESIGAHFMVYETTAGEGRRPGKTTVIERAAGDAGALYFNSFDAFFEESGGTKKFCFKHDGHWNARGHAFAAREIYKYLREREWA
ncbi:MAG: hypothetical protein Q8R76_11130 [Candidatus Omnitrophota bacterium]|nr:hypothetical protein [Candidatus Omnitrophota bacterium]